MSQNSPHTGYLPDEAWKSCILGCSGLCGQSCAGVALIFDANLIHIFNKLARTKKCLGAISQNQQEVCHFRSKSQFWYFTHILFQWNPPRDVIRRTIKLVYVLLCVQKACVIKSCSNRCNNRRWSNQVWYLTLKHKINVTLKPSKLSSAKCMGIMPTWSLTHPYVNILMTL